MDKQARKLRDVFLPIAVIEHQLLARPTLSTFDIAERLVLVWGETERDARSGKLSLDANCILAINEKIARSFDSEPGTFLDEDGWLNFLEASGSVEEGTTQALSWIFSTLYWKHLTKYRLATAWLYNNALRVQHQLPSLNMTLEKLGPFLDSLSGSGPPLYDGQTFYPEDYAIAMANDRYLPFGVSDSVSGDSGVD